MKYRDRDSLINALFCVTVGAICITLAVLGWDEGQRWLDWTLVIVASMYFIVSAGLFFKYFDSAS